MTSSAKEQYLQYLNSENERVSSRNEEAFTQLLEAHQALDVKTSQDTTDQG